MIKTEYRIIPLETFIGDMYLQFKSIELRKSIFGKIKQIEVWRFIPTELHSYVSGKYMDKNDCPTSIPYLNEANFLHSFYKHEEFDLIPFTKMYSDIDEYFKLIRSKREKYLKDESDKKFAKTIYL